MYTSGSSISISEVRERLGELVRRQSLLVGIVACAVVGLGISVYLTTIHYEHVAPVCTVTGIINCANVLKSRFSVVPGTGIPITIPGMFWFVISGGLALVGLFRYWRGEDEPARLRLVQLLWSAAGLLFVLYLVYDEIVQLHIICEWCTGVHILTLVTFILAWYRFSELGRTQVEAARRSPGARPAIEKSRKAASVNGTRAAQGYALPRGVRSKAAGGRRSGSSRPSRGSL
jgi:uncharacterized membrane protein